uniref:MULE transposase domain-containing protein n=1 Tax=Hyaloperonospora arabidopsidis (strain Emoy2) TaxID=559515 RepID=M4BHT3_HYAAE
MESPCNQNCGHPQASEEEQAVLPASKRNRRNPSVVDNIRRLYNSGLKNSAVILRYILGASCNDGLLITLNDVYGLIRDMKMEELDGRAAIEVMFHRLQMKGSMQQQDLTSTTMSRTPFSLHFASADFTRCYGDALIIDCTYKTNAAKMLLAHTVGVTGTGATFASSYAFLSSETMADYIWSIRKVDSTLAGPPKLLSSIRKKI